MKDLEIIKSNLAEFLDILKAKKRNDGEVWTQPSGRKVTKKNGKIVPVSEGKKQPKDKEKPEEKKLNKNKVTKINKNNTSLPTKNNQKINNKKESLSKSIPKTPETYEKRFNMFIKGLQELANKTGIFLESMGGVEDLGNKRIIYDKNDFGSGDIIPQVVD